VESAQEELLVAEPADLHRLQGAAVALNAMLKIFTVPRPVIKPDEPPAAPLDGIELW
jgi:hypothetical protein